MGEVMPPSYTDNRSLPTVGLAVLLLIIVLLSSLLWQLHRTIKTQMHAPFNLQQPTTHVVQPGQSLKEIANGLAQAGLVENPLLFTIYSWLVDAEHSLQAGEYKVLLGDNPKRLLQRMVQGDVTVYKTTFPEGITFAQTLSILRSHPQIINATNSAGQHYSIGEISDFFALPGNNAEGWFYPDTYSFPAATKDLQILRMAHAKMQKTLQLAWSNRPEDLVYEEPYQVLIMASIIEKEGVYHDEYELISGVFHRRLQRKIPLYSDPTVAYAHGAEFKPPLLHRHMRIESPYNTYKHQGLPPSPIALPSAAAIAAALNPAPGDSLYFVALGNGRHHFSKTLKEHNLKRQELKKIKADKAYSNIKP